MSSEEMNQIVKLTLNMKAKALYHKTINSTHYFFSNNFCLMKAQEFWCFRAYKKPNIWDWI